MIMSLNHEIKWKYKNTCSFKLIEKNPEKQFDHAMQIIVMNYIFWFTKRACDMMQNEDFGVRSRYLRQGQVIASRSNLWDAITYPCLRYLIILAWDTCFWH